ncbi:helix-turn-helix domain-containing protein [Paractinoplanes ferrugineus]|uniref:Transcriptional regulator n=1 Tax=Paractinoplanes ferrugineus TaxID=113564 RepID=A0A919J7X6_9ACTN|nr:RNA-binding domain-containing protein [Actinoplanes ferrugineus]GIE14952.1 transcriptional regulator [Actinoplanes ferrugineus]
MSPTRPPDQLARLVKELLTLPAETEWVEDKNRNHNPDEIGQYISALANGAALVEHERGYLLWGIEDGTREILDTTFQPSTTKVGNENLDNWLLRHLSPQVHFQFHEAIVDQKRVVVLEIDKAANQPVTFKSDAYIRIGSYKKKLSEHNDVERRLWKAFVLGSFEDGTAATGLEPSEILQLLDYPSYFRLMKMPLPENRSGILDALLAEGMITRDDAGVWSILNLGAILFAHNLADFPSLHRKAIRVMQYQGGNRMETLKEQEGVLGYASGFEGLVKFINGLLPSNEIIGQALRQTVKMYPELAVRELIANALIHQDFHISGSGPTVEIFDDRIEITNPGRPLVDPLRFIDSPPLSRNEKLGRVMRRGGICEERGSGWDKIGFEIEYHQLPAPLVEVTQDHTKVTLYGHRDLKDMDRSDRVRAVYLHACLRYVSGKKSTNTTVRERFGIDPKNSARASRLIKEAMEEGLVVLRDPQAPLKLREYVPWWAGPELTKPS